MNAEKENSFLEIGFFRFSAVHEELLKAQALSCICPGTLRKLGNSVERRKSYYAGRSTLSVILGTRGDSGCIAADETWGYVTLRDKKSGLLQENRFLSISHSEDLAMVALGSVPVGVDVEKASRSADKVFSRILSEDERINFAKLQKTNRISNTPIALWSAKESFSKLTGLGIKFGLKHFSFTAIQSGEWQGVTTLTGPMDHKSSILKQIVFEEFIGSICFPRETKNLRLRFFRIVLEGGTLQAREFDDGK